MADRDFAQELESRRLNERRKVKEFAALIGCDTGTWYRVRHGQRRLTQEQIFLALAQYPDLAPVAITYVQETGRRLFASREKSRGVQTT